MQIYKEGFPFEQLPLTTIFPLPQHSNNLLDQFLLYNKTQTFSDIKQQLFI